MTTPAAWSLEETKAAARDALLEIFFSGERITEAYDLRAKRDFRTAAWTYGPPHKIYVGTGIPTKAKPGLDRESIGLYIQRHVFHEFGHLLWTERDLAGLRERLSPRVDFSLFNLFEDARIEARFRSERQQAFEWSRFENVAPDLMPNGMFFALVQFEGDVAAVEAHYAPTLSATGEDQADHARTLVRVHHYYQRAIAAPSSSALFPVLEEWCEEFPQPSSFTPCRGSEQESDGDNACDLMPGLKAQQSPGDAATLEAGSEAVGQTGPSGKHPGPVDAEDGEGTNLLGEERTPLPVARIERLAQRLAELFTAKSRRVTGEVPTRRLSARHFVLDQPCYRRDVIEQARRSTVLLVVDCSGSMQGYHLQEGQLLMAALSLLATRGVVSGDVLLSAVLRKRAVWQRFRLPMSIASVERVQALGDAEGLEHTIRDHQALARQADRVFVYTDGHICDKPINKMALHAQGIHTWGLYSGEAGQAQRELTKFFDKALVRENAEQLVEAMLSQAHS